MKDVYEVLRQKEEQCAHLRKEIDALRLVSRLLDPGSEQAHGSREADPRPSPVNEAERSDAPTVHMGSRATQGVAPEEESQESAPALQQSGSAVNPREESSESDRKGPLSASLNESSWWRRKTGR